MTATLDIDIAPQAAYVRLLSDNLAAEFGTITRTMSGKTSVVRGADKVPLALLGTMKLVIVRDHEILYNTPIVYNATTYDINGNMLEQAVSSTVTVTDSRGWLRDVLVPSLSTPVRLVGMDSGDGENESRRALLRPLGRKNPVVVTDTRSGYSGTSTALTMTAAEQSSLEALFASGHVLLFTGPAEWGQELPRYIHIGNVSVKRQSAALEEARLFSWDWVEVDAPDLTLYEPIVPATWQTLADAGTLWADTVGTPWFDLMFPITTRSVAWSA